MISFKINNIRFNYRVAGILIENGRVLLEKDFADGFWVLPGGRCEIKEKSSDAVCREFYEELGIKIRTPQLISLNENFYEYEEFISHEIGLYYLCEAEEDITKLSCHTEEFEGLEKTHIYRWWKLNQVASLEFYPEELKVRISNEVFGDFYHFVTNDLGSTSSNQ